ncbi:hypothetical protein FN846DRAFT_773624 [Sphaerosporella brunnea]|uniref:F-box domain-containing protein n=1 Tax=Sphaerosporella brunnea TaxID=1250544 RepID=A0A5J5F5C7_9PEZI|nr:hypothetical protein FN846DRAFT_773624 [Sphaerosporella brunnea]
MRNGGEKKYDRKGKGKERARSSAFERLPREIIQEILYTADPNTFDSLTLINSAWHQVSRNVRLYTHQLARCGITSIPSDSADDETLPTLIRLFNEAGRRELFETVLRPRVTETQLIYSASSSAAACPGGEAFRFEFSPKGTHLLALLSSRIFVIDLSQPDMRVKRELKSKRRPVSAAILDDGSILAVLSSNHHVTLYDLTGAKARIIRGLPLDNEPRTIALSPGAEVLGAAYDGGIEVYSLHPDAGPMDRRAVNCDTVDSLAFSSDGTILLGTTLNPKSPTTVIVSAQHFSTDMPVEGLAQLWTTQVLFPRSSRDSSHASLLPGEEDEEGATWTFTYDRVYETFRAVRVDDLRNGHTYFAGPNDEDMKVIQPATLPSSTRDGSLVAAGFGGGKVWVYGIPGKLDLPLFDPNAEYNGSIASTPERSNSNASRSGARERVRSVVVPQWQVLCDKIRNVFIRGREVGQVTGLSSVKFVMGVDGTERLVTVAGGGVDDTLGEYGEEEVFGVGGGRVTVFEFVRGPRVGSKTVISIEVGDGIQGPVETLEEEQRDIEVEVDIARRRTVAVRRNGRNGRTAASRQGIFPFEHGNTNEHSPPAAAQRQRNMPLSTSETTSARARPVSPLSFPDEADNTDPLDDPYIPNAPRSRSALQRAATVARSVPQTADASRYARAVGPDGRPTPTPHPAPTQDGERWEPPPPPYTPRNDNPVPLPPQLLWSLQGPPRHPEVHMPAPNAVPTETGLERTSTLGNVMRRGSLFRIATNSSSSRNNISVSRSAPVSPAVPQAVPMVYSQSNLSQQQFLSVPAVPPPRRLSEGHHVNHPDGPPPVPMIPIEHYAPLHAAGSYPQPQPRPPQPQQRLTAPRAPAPRGISPSPRRNRSVRRTQLRETYTASVEAASQLSPPPIPSPRGVSPGNARNSVIVGRSGSVSVMRRPSRASRSAQSNVREARRKREEKKASSKGEKGCVIM